MKADEGYEKGYKVIVRNRRTNEILINTIACPLPEYSNPKDIKEGYFGEDGEYSECAGEGDSHKITIKYIGQRKIKKS